MKTLILSGPKTRGAYRTRKVKPPVYIEDKTLTAVDPTPPPPPPPPPRPVAPQVRTMIFVTPRIVRNDQVEKPPPVVDSLDHVRIGTVNTPGGADAGITAPPASDGLSKGVVAAPKKDADDGAGFMKIEKESEYPGGPGAWLRYLNRNLRTPDEALDKGISGTVVVQFVVDQEGNVSDVQAISGPVEGGLREEAVRVIKKSGRWTPALQNGRYVKTYKMQPITFTTVQE